jgi:dihydropteroate synthase
LKAGVAPPRITIDPGIGFGKRLEDNSALIRAIPELRSLGLTVLLGVSRKSFLGMITGTERPADRTGETAAAVATCALLGADVLRVHDVSLLVPAVRVARALGGH